jgi:hypothetical protein
MNAVAVKVRSGSPEVTMIIIGAILVLVGTFMERAAN